MEQRSRKLKVHVPVPFENNVVVIIIINSLENKTKTGSHHKAHTKQKIQNITDKNKGINQQD